MLGYHAGSWDGQGLGGADTGRQGEIGRYLQACPLITLDIKEKSRCILISNGDIPAVYKVERR